MSGSASTCTNATVVSMDAVDRSVLAVLGEDVLRPEMVEAVLAGVFEAKTDGGATAAQRLQDELGTVEREMARLSEAIASGGRLDPLLAALKQRHARRDGLVARVNATRTVSVPMDRPATERRVRRKLEDWRSLLNRNVQGGRQLFREILDGPIRF